MIIQLGKEAGNVQVVGGMAWCSLNSGRHRWAAPLTEQV